MNYTQLINLFNLYLKDDTATDFATFLQNHPATQEHREKLNLSGLTSGKAVNGSKNAKYQELLKYIVANKIAINGSAAAKDLHAFYNKMIVKDAYFNLSKAEIAYLYKDVKPVGSKRNENFKLRKTGKAKYALFSVGFKKILLPALITGAAIAGVLATAGALLPVGALGILTDSVAINAISGAVVGFPIGAVASAGIIGIKNLVTRVHYSRRLKKENGLKDLLEDIKETQEKIATKKGFFHAIGNYFRRNKNRNRLWAVLKYREKASAEYDNLHKLVAEQGLNPETDDNEHANTLQVYENNIGMIDTFMRSHMENVYKQHLITKRPMEDMDIIGKYYQYDAANDSKTLIENLKARGYKHPGQRSTADVQSTVKGVVGKIVAEHLVGKVSEGILTENQILGKTVRQLQKEQDANVKKQNKQNNKEQKAAKPAPVQTPRQQQRAAAAATRKENRAAAAAARQQQRAAAAATRQEKKNKQLVEDQNKKNERDILNQANELLDMAEQTYASATKAKKPEQIAQAKANAQNVKNQVESLYYSSNKNEIKEILNNADLVAIKVFNYFDELDAAKAKEQEALQVKEQQRKELNNQLVELAKTADKVKADATDATKAKEVQEKATEVINSAKAIQGSEYADSAIKKSANDIIRTATAAKLAAGKAQKNAEEQSKVPAQKPTVSKANKTIDQYLLNATEVKSDGTGNYELVAYVQVKYKDNNGNVDKNWGKQTAIAVKEGSGLLAGKKNLENLSKNPTALHVAICQKLNADATLSNKSMFGVSPAAATAANNGSTPIIPQVVVPKKNKNKQNNANNLFTNINDANDYLK